MDAFELACGRERDIDCCDGRRADADAAGACHELVGDSGTRAANCGTGVLDPDPELSKSEWKYVDIGAERQRGSASMAEA
jgi:hypothetical protein